MCFQPSTPKPAAPPPAPLAPPSDLKVASGGEEDIEKKRQGKAIFRRDGVGIQSGSPVANALRIGQ